MTVPIPLSPSDRLLIDSVIDDLAGLISPPSGTVGTSVVGADAPVTAELLACVTCGQLVEMPYDNSGPPYTLDGMDPVLRDLIVCAVHGAMSTSKPPPEGHWLTSSWELGRALLASASIPALPVAWMVRRRVRSNEEKRAVYLFHTEKQAKYEFDGWLEFPYAKPELIPLFAGLGTPASGVPAPDPTKDLPPGDYRIVHPITPSSPPSDAEMSDTAAPSAPPFA